MLRGTPLGESSSPLCSVNPSSSAFVSRNQPAGPTVVSIASAPTRSRGTDGMQSVVAGIIAGCVTRSCTSPLDVLKIIIQVNGSVSRSASRAVHHSRSFLASANGVLRGQQSSSVVLRTVNELYSLEGMRGFWKGNAAGCCRLGPYAGAKFFLFDSLQARFADSDPSNLSRALCGAIAGLIATMTTYPLEVVRTRMITQTALTPAHLQINGVIHGLQSIMRQEGIRGFYKGGWSGVIGAIPFEGVQFGCYEYLKHSSQANHWPSFRWPEGKSELDGVDYFVCGSVAGAVAQAVAYPFDTVKKRLQLQMVPPSTSGSGASCVSSTSDTIYYRGMVDCFRKVVRDEGLFALYRGTVPNLARIVPYAAVMFSTFEMSKKSLRVLCEAPESSG